MKKKLLVIVMALILVLSLAACGPGKDDTSQAKAAAEEYLKAVKNLDFKKANELSAKGNIVGEGEGTKEEARNAVFKKFMNKLNYSYASGEVEKDAKETKLTYKIKSKDFTEFIGKILEIGLANVQDEKKAAEEINKIDVDGLKESEYDVTFDLVKVDDKWKIADSEEALSDLTNLKLEVPKIDMPELPKQP